MTSSTMSQQKGSTPEQCATASGQLPSPSDIAAWVHSEEFRRAAASAGVPGIATTMYFLLDSSTSGHRAAPEDTATYWGRLLDALDHPIYR